MPTPDEIRKAFEDGMKHHGKGMGTHTSHGQHLSPYAKEGTDPELLRAWLAGYERARGQST